MERLIKIVEDPYPIYIGELNSFDFEQFQRIIKAFSQIIIFADENTKLFCLPKILSLHSFRNAKVIVLKSGESAKSIDKATEIWSEFTEMNINRNTLVINLGGGVVSDFGGFVASVFKRGLHYINIPTTLLSMIDASIGGKTGINFNGYKNQLGVFSNPEVIFIDVDFLKTLPKKDLLSGFSELIKHALIMDPNLWEMVKNTKPELIIKEVEIIKRAVLVKSHIVNSDPFEKDIRKILNYGHTIAHAFESYSLSHDANPILHGEAVAIGLICETYISVIKNGLDLRIADEIYKCIHSLFPEYKIENKAIVELLSIMKQDKKNKNTKVNFTLLSEIGKALIDNECDDDLIAESINFYTNLYKTR